MPRNCSMHFTRSVQLPTQKGAVEYQGVRKQRDAQAQSVDKLQE